MSEAVLTLRGIQKSYGRHSVLKGLDMTVNRGDIYGLIGKNGAGKTTAFKIILGMSEFQGGSLSLLGENSSRGLARSRSRIGYFVGFSFFGYLSGRDNLHYHRRLKGIRDRKEVERVLEKVSLSGQAADTLVRDYSMGMRQRLGLANALLGNPELLILDEPTNGLDPQGIADIRGLLTDINAREGTTVLVSSHILGELEHTAFRFGIVNEGVLVKELTQEDLSLHTGRISIEVEDSQAERAKALLQENGISVLGTKQASESLEDFYFHLMGGEGND